MAGTKRSPNKMKKLYRVTTALEKTENVVTDGRSWDVLAVNAQQSIRKALYNLTKNDDALAETEFIDEVKRLGTIEIK